MIPNSTRRYQLQPSEITACGTRLAHMRSDLLAQIAQQRGGVISRAEAAANHFGTPEDSNAPRATERDLEFALGERELEELGALDAALQRIAAGTYGECTDCGVEIPAARLQATPEAPRCIACQEQVEKHHA